jgi:hypothetical protein
MRWARAAAVLAGAMLVGAAGITVLAGGAAASQVTASMAGTQSAVTAQVSLPAGHWGDAHQVDLSALQPGNGPIGIDALSCASRGRWHLGGARRADEWRDTGLQLGRAADHVADMPSCG